MLAALRELRKVLDAGRCDYFCRPRALKSSADFQSAVPLLYRRFVIGRAYNTSRMLMFASLAECNSAIQQIGKSALQLRRLTDILNSANLHALESEPVKLVKSEVRTRLKSAKAIKITIGTHHEHRSLSAVIHIRNSWRTDRAW